MIIKTFACTFLLLSLFTNSISTSANILDDLKNGFGQNKNKMDNKIKDSKNQSQLELDDSEGENIKICKIQKGYATKHFENRQSEQSKGIQDKITSINKIKLILVNNKQDLKSLELTIDNLIKLLNQKLELLKTRVKTADSINCGNAQNFAAIRSNLQELNLKLNQLDKDITSQTREFGGEVQLLVIKLKQPKVERV